MIWLTLLSPESKSQGFTLAITTTTYYYFISTVRRSNVSSTCYSPTQTKYLFQSQGTCLRPSIHPYLRRHHQGYIFCRAKHPLLPSNTLRRFLAFFQKCLVFFNLWSPKEAMHAVHSFINIQGSCGF